MNNKLFFQGAAASCLVLAFALGGAATPAGASPLAAAGAAAQAAPETMVIAVQSEKRERRAARRAAPPPDRLHPNDTVVTIIYDGRGYGYNRFTGERYMKCMIDLGYGRVIPCDAGNDGPGWN